MSATAFSVLFLLCLACATAIRLWLARRQIQHVLRHRARVPQEFADTISLGAHQRAADYTAARVALGQWSTVAGVGLALVLTLGGGIQALHTAWSAWLAPASLTHGVALMASVAVASWLVDLPFSLYKTFGIEARFGFNRMTPALYVGDLARQAGLAIVLGLPILAGLLWVIAAAGPRWWLYAWGCWLGLNLLLMVVWPTFIAPLFNRFQPLAEGEMKARIEALLTRCGFRSSGLFVMDGSRRSAHGNAYFTGLGAAKRIVFFDTLLDKLQPAEVEAVLAHELGHFRHRHVVKRLALLAVGSLGLFALLGWLVEQAWFFNGLGVQARDTATALILFMEVAPVFLFPLGPLMSQWSRRHEFEADAYAARQTNAQDLVSALVKLYRDNASTLTPDPYYSSFHDSHPPAAVRVARLKSMLQGNPP
jgi:STE24 endopeptidase